MDHEKQILLELVLIIALGGAAQWFAWRLRLPSILLLLLAGFTAGPLTGLVKPDELFPGTLLPLVSLSVGVVLFEGGLTLNFRELRQTGHVVRNLVTIGALITWLLSAGAGYLLFGEGDWRMPVLLGAIVIVTGPTVIMPLLRHVRPTGSIGSVLKWEGIVIDPVGALVTVLAFEVLYVQQDPDASMHVALALGRTIFVGGGLGLLGAGLLAVAMARYWIPEFLQNAVTLFVVCCVFALSNVAQPEAGLFAVTVMGIAMANQRIADVKHIREFKENLRVFLISALFILLGARVKLESLGVLGWNSVVFVALLILVIRPIGVFVSSLGSKLTWNERVFAACMAPRGIVAAAIASVFAIELERRGVVGAELLVPITFITIVGTVLVYGLAASPIAQWLKLAEANPQGVIIVGAHKLARLVAHALREHKIRTLLIDSNRSEVATAKMESLPTYHGSVLGEETLEEIDLGGMGRLLALTPNDEVNVLAVQRFVPLFGRASVYQLRPHEGHASRSGGMDKHLHGRWLFSDDATYEHLESLVNQGAIVKGTKLTEEFDYIAFRRMYGPKAVPMFVLTDNKRLNIRVAEQSTEPKPGSVLISLVLEVEAPAGTKEDKAIRRKTEKAMKRTGGGRPPHQPRSDTST